MKSCQFVQESSSVAFDGVMETDIRDTRKHSC